MMKDFDFSDYHETTGEPRRDSKPEMPHDEATINLLLRSLGFPEDAFSDDYTETVGMEDDLTPSRVKKQSGEDGNGL